MTSTFTWKSPSRPSLKLKVTLDDVEFYEFLFKRNGHDSGMVIDKEYIQEQIEEWDTLEVVEELFETGNWDYAHLQAEWANNIRLAHIALLDIFNNMSHYEDEAE